MLSNLLVQLVNGLADACALFLVASGLSLIFGVTRIVNFAHGSLYMLGVYVAYSLTSRFGTSVAGFWASLAGAALLVGAIGAAIEMSVLRRIYRAPELFHLLATFALVLIIRDAALWLWGPDDLFGPRAPHLEGAVQMLGHALPAYDLALIVIGPLVLLALWYALTRTRWGTLVRAASADREMLGALGVNQAWLFTGVFFVGAMLAGLGGALQVPRMSANLSLDIETIGNAFVVVVVGGMGSIPGAFVAALLIAEIKAMCIGIGHVSIIGVDFSLSKFTLAAEFVVMAVVLVLRPWGLFGRAQTIARSAAPADQPLRPATRAMKIAGAVVVIALALAPLAADAFPYMPVLFVEIMIAVLFAASLHFIMGPGGMHSFGHAAYFGLGAYGAALFLKVFALPMEAALVLGPLIAGIGTIVFGWFCVRLSGVYLAMLTLAFAQIVWSVVFQWDAVTGGSNGILGIWPSPWLSSPVAFYYLTLAFALIGVWLLRRMLFSPLGLAMRAGRDSPLRAEAIGVNVARVQWAAFVAAALVCGLAGSLYAFSKGNISPEAISVGRSVDGLVMVLLGGIQTLAGPIVGASVFTWLQDAVARQTDYWQALLGAAILVLVIAFPQGIAGFVRERFFGGGAMTLLSIAHLSKSFDGVHAVDDVSFELQSGQLLALIGPNGAGKSTCFNMINGQLKPTAGTIRFDGHDIAGMRPRDIWRRGVGRTFQIAATFNSMTVLENVQMALLSRERRVYTLFGRVASWKEDEALALLDLVGMATHARRSCAVLAYGDVKRVELAIALANHPKLLLMDEPTAGMAPQERNELMALTARLAKERNIGVLFTEHSMDVVFSHADKLIVLARGRLIAQGDAEAIRNDARVREVYLGTGASFSPRVGAST